MGFDIGKRPSFLRRSSVTADESGQAIVEFAVTMPLLVFILFACMQLIFLYLSTLMVDFAAFRACRAAITAWDVNEDGSVNQTDREENAYVTAKMLLSPLSFHDAAIDGTETSAITVPGWGELAGSQQVDGKLSISVVDDTDAGTVKTVVEFPQELIFPFVDQVFAMIAGSWGHSDLASDDSVWGVRRTGDNFTYAWNETPHYDDPSLPRVMKFGSSDRLHYIISRSMTLADLSDAEPSE